MGKRAQYLTPLAPVTGLDPKQVMVGSGLGLEKEERKRLLKFRS